VIRQVREDGRVRGIAQSGPGPVRPAGAAARLRRAAKRVAAIEAAIAIAAPTHHQIAVVDGVLVPVACF